MEETEKKYTIEIIKDNIIKMKLEEILEIVPVNMKCKKMIKENVNF